MKPKWKAAGVTREGGGIRAAGDGSSRMFTVEKNAREWYS